MVLTMQLCLQLGTNWESDGLQVIHFYALSWLYDPKPNPSK